MYKLFCTHQLRKLSRKQQQQQQQQQQEQQDGKGQDFRAARVVLTSPSYYSPATRKLQRSFSHDSLSTITTVLQDHNGEDTEPLPVVAPVRRRLERSFSHDSLSTITTTTEALNDINSPILTINPSSNSYEKHCAAIEIIFPPQLIARHMQRETNYLNNYRQHVETMQLRLLERQKQQNLQQTNHERVSTQYNYARTNYLKRSQAIILDPTRDKLKHAVSMTRQESDSKLEAESLQPPQRSKSVERNKCARYNMFCGARLSLRPPQRETSVERNKSARYNMFGGGRLET